jgi:hypothetical protein
VDGDNRPQSDIVVVAENNLFVSGFLAGIEELHDVASLNGDSSEMRVSTPGRVHGARKKMKIFRYPF